MWHKENWCDKGGDNECSHLLRSIGGTPSGRPADFGSKLRIRVLTFAIVKTGSIDNVGGC